MAQDSQRLLPIMTGQPVIPVLRIERAEDAAPLGRALAKGGLPAIEVTLRTRDALEAIRCAAGEVEEALVGAGTVLNAAQYRQAVEAGAKFVVSPGLTPQLVDAAGEGGVPLLPGAITPGEVMIALEAGYSLLKFFPAEQAGGLSFLKALAAPLAGARFCPTGGITASNAASYLALPNVLCVGGSWVAPDEALNSGRWDEVERLAREAASLRLSRRA